MDKILKCADKIMGVLGYEDPWLSKRRSDVVKILKGLVAQNLTDDNSERDEIIICRGGDCCCEHKTVNYRCLSKEWCSFKLELPPISS